MIFHERTPCMGVEFWGLVDNEQLAEAKFNYFSSLLPGP